MKPPLSFWKLGIGVWGLAFCSVPYRIVSYCIVSYRIVSDRIVRRESYFSPARTESAVKPPHPPSPASEHCMRSVDT
eukprot:scaffold7039_cov255-Pinguiococcus_pyrenoidosus.AAC.19